MNLQHVNVKIYVDGELTVDWKRCLEVFHRWVATQSMDEMLIDVVDYRHVPAGPGVVLVGHEADYALDNANHRPGLRYNCKVARDGTNEDRVRHALTAAANACLRLETELESLKFSQQYFAVFINDRALAPNNEATFKACQSEFPRVVEKVLGTSDFQLDYNRDPRSLFGCDASLAQPFDWTQLVI